MFARRASFFFLGLVAIAVLCAVPALGWAGSSAGAGAFGTHQWILHEANRQSALQGFDWANMAIAQPAADEPDAVLRDFSHNVYDVWGPSPYLLPRRRSHRCPLAHHEHIVTDKAGGYRKGSTDNRTPGFGFARKGFVEGA